MESLLGNEPLLYSIGVLTAFVLLWLAFSPDMGVKGSYDKRLKRVRGGLSIPQKLQSNASINIRLDGDKSIFDTIMKKILPNTDILKNRLMRTGKDLTLTHFGLMWLSSAIVIGLIIFLKLKIMPVFAAVGGIALGLMLTNMIINFMIGRRLKKFIQSFPDAIDLMVRGIKSGLPISQTVQSISTEIDGPVGEEFTKISDAMKIGTDLNEALWSRARKLDIPELKFFCIALTIQKETGGNLSETLGNLSTILRKRKQMKLKIKAMSSEAKASAIIIGSLPFIMYVILKIMSPEYVEPLLNDPRGIKLVIGGLVTIGLGTFIMSKMVSFEI